MPYSVFDTPAPFITKARKQVIALIPLNEKKAKSWIGKQDNPLQETLKSQNFTGKPGETAFIFDDKGRPAQMLIGASDPLGLYDLAAAIGAIQNRLSDKIIESACFKLDDTALKKGEDADKACLGWALGCYKFTRYKDGPRSLPALLWPKNADQKRVTALFEALCLLRNMINTPANDMGPEEIEATARTLADTYKAKVKVTQGPALEDGYPLVHAVGKASPRAPRLIDLRWGKADAPEIAIIGKGVCFDTGGLNIKPTAYMALMKKDMGGAAHALALAKMVMGLGLPVSLRLLIPAVDNDVSGGAFRPGDILRSRKGLTVENTNTDAEGRLILADALTAASEEKKQPDLIIDFATLTGSARAALGPDVPPFFCNDDKTAKTLQDCADNNEDPLWRMPLWQPYQEKNKSAIADLVNSAKTPGDLIYSALFLEQFLIGTPPWIHLDVYAWQDSAKPGRTQGGTDMGLRAVLALLEQRYAG